MAGVHPVLLSFAGAIGCSSAPDGYAAISPCKLAGRRPTFSGKCGMRRHHRVLHTARHISRPTATPNAFPQRVGLSLRRSRARFLAWIATSDAGRPGRVSERAGRSRLAHAAPRRSDRLFDPMVTGSRYRPSPAMLHRGKRSVRHGGSDRVVDLLCWPVLFLPGESSRRFFQWTALHAFIRIGAVGTVCTGALASGFANPDGSPDR